MSDYRNPAAMDPPLPECPCDDDDPVGPTQFRIADATTEILKAIGEDPRRDGLLKTPARVARMYAELTAGYHIDSDRLINGAVFDAEFDEMVVVKDIEFHSLCEHHMLPFMGKAHVAYIPAGKVIGLSKIPRIVEMFARRLQVQERMTHQIGEFIEKVLSPAGTAVVLEGHHLCAGMRGVKKPSSLMTTSRFSGTFKTDPQLRNEFLALIAKSL